MSVEQWLTPDGLTAITAVLALGGVIFEYGRLRRHSSAELAQQKLEHERQQKQARIELAQRLMEQVETDEMIRFATTSLDWSAGVIPVPMVWRDIIKEPMVQADPAAVIEATQRNLTDRVRNDPKKLLIRHAFVALFNLLDRVESLRSVEAIDIRDLQPIEWIAHRLMKWQYAPGPDKRDQFRGALDGWYEPGKLMRLILLLRNQNPDLDEFPDQTLPTDLVQMPDA